MYSSHTDHYYIGHTGDLIRRIKDHNSGFCKSTKNGLPWKVKFEQSSRTRGKAMKLENKIKKRGARRFLNDLGVS